MQYRKKPVVVSAIQYDGKWDTVQQMIKTLGMEPPVTWHMRGRPYMEISTLEGVMKANVGDWIIRGIKGECYPCKPDIFECTYEKVGKELPRNACRIVPEKECNDCGRCDLIRDEYFAEVAENDRM